MKNDLFFRCWNERCRLMRGAAFTLAEVFSSHCADFRKSAFTLAEVLITLAIIGVVAAMTLPTLIQNHQKQTYVTGLKKAVNISQNMLKKMQADEGASSIGTTQLFSEGMCQYIWRFPTDEYGNEIIGVNPVNGNGCEDWYGNPSVFEALVPKYLKIVKICKGNDCKQLYGGSSFTSCSASNTGCKLREYKDYPVRPCDITLISEEACASLQGFYTSDGMIFYIYPSPERPGRSAPTVEFLVDVNGQKGPNVLNRDLFEYGFYANGKMREESLSEQRKDGLSVIMQNGWKMDY